MILTHTVTTPASVTELATVQECRDEITGLADDDAEASRLLHAAITAASAQIAQYLGYAPGRTRYALTARVPNTGGVLLPAPIDPVVHSAMIESVPTGYTLEFGGIIRVAKTLQTTDLEVDYESGWPLLAASVDVPIDLTRATVLLVADAWLRRGQPSGLASQDVEGIARVSFEPPIGLAPEVRELLSPYVRTM